LSDKTLTPKHEKSFAQNIFSVFFLKIHTWIRVMCWILNLLQKTLICITLIF